MVSLGPGDIELITIKGLRALQNCDAILIPTKSEDNSFNRSLTYKMIQELQKEFNFTKELIPVYTPMNFLEKDWENQVSIINDSFKKYDKICFVTLGDSAIYSTVYYLLDIIKKQNINLYTNSEVIAGITSFSNASALVKKPLCIGDSGLNIVPLLDKEVSNTTIYMRPKIGMDTSIIKENGTIYTFENLGLKDSKIYPNKIPNTTKYMTLFIDFIK
jgi:precorrin-2/cobalt-factor-2 C20-methyltransferase